MKRPKPNNPPEKKAPVPGIVLTGFLIFLIHPTVFGGVQLPSFSLLAWLHWVPLLAALGGLRFRKQFLFAFLSGVIGHFGLLFWLATAMHGFGGLHWIQATGVLTALVLLLSAVLALFIALAVWSREKLGLPFAAVLPLFLTARDALLHHFPFGGYPWGIAPYSQGEWLGLFQWVDHAGVFGLGFLIYLVNGLAADAWMKWRPDRQFKPAALPAGLIAAVLALSFSCSHLASKKFEASKTLKGEIALAAIQPNIRQDMKWNPKKAFTIVEELKNLTRKAIAAGAKLVFWPETSFPFGFQEHLLKQTRFLDGEITGVPILFGAFILRQEPQGHKQFNAVIHVAPDGSMAADYRKIHLVPFGEYLPLARHLKFMEGLTQGIGHFNAGTDYTLFGVEGLKIASLICIEDVFPIYGRKFSAGGADLLVNYTNDAWYGDSSAQHQHLVYSQFRALENRKPLVRVTNTGVSAVIDARGSVLEALTPFQASYLLKTLPIETGDAFYSRHGDGWVWIPILAAFGLTVAAFLRKNPLPTKKN